MDKEDPRGHFVNGRRTEVLVVVVFNAVLNTYEQRWRFGIAITALRVSTKLLYTLSLG